MRILSCRNSTRVAFTKEDQSHVVDWLVKYHPQKENRRGNVVWKQLTKDKVNISLRTNFVRKLWARLSLAAMLPQNPIDSMAICS